MDNYLYKILSDTIEYIESHMFEPITLDVISKNVNISKYHLLRLWSGATAIGLIEYVRKRKVSHSLSDLLLHQNSIEYIASKYGFGCVHSYNRIFKDMFGTTPAKWRRNPCQLQIVDRFNLDLLNCVDKGLLHFKGAVILPELQLAGVEHVVNIALNKKEQLATQLAISFFEDQAQEIKEPVQSHIYVGFTLLRHAECDYTLYRPSIQISEVSVIPDHFVKTTIPAHRYGVFTYIGAHGPEAISSKTLFNIWNYVQQTWMPTVHFNLTEKFRFEWIDLKKCSSNYCECDLYYPIEEI